MKDNMYFNNTRTQYRQKSKYGVSFDLESDMGAREEARNKWNELRAGLGSEKYSFDKEEMKEIPFIGALHKILEYENARKLITIELKHFAKSKKFVRAAIVDPEETISMDRFIPRSDKMKAPNRFSPKGVEWLYLGFDRYLNDAKECCLAELRAKGKDNVRFCEFKYNNGEHKVIDLTRAIYKDLKSICQREGRTAGEVIEPFLLEFFLKILSEEIFLPVNTKEKDREYAPFHFMANYFESLGYDGIIYKSTVSKVGKNLVMFDKDSFFPTEIF